ncbi:RICIN domain-containing protein [Streptomyces chrestomyceticus]|uniref:RICIN domain-containing protein n=1 Tax=Streptomyces chrestomyceticus TaxID=68185 RepID=UPI0035A8DD67
MPNAPEHPRQPALPPFDSTTEYYIDHLQSSLHLNSVDYSGSAGAAVLFNDRDNADWSGERWKLTEQQDGSYFITNVATGNYLVVASAAPRYASVTVAAPDAKDVQWRWVLRSSGLLGSFSLHPAITPGVAVAPKTWPYGQGAPLHLIPFDGAGYLTHLFKVTTVAG